jgi:competence protein ComEA
MRNCARMFVLAIMIFIFAISASFSFAEGNAKGEPSKAAVQNAAKININKATVDQLKEINGIGESYAKGIVAYREKNGPFKKIEDIKEVKGIGDKLFEKIKDQITIESTK